MHEHSGVPLAPLTTLRLGGPARRLVEVDKPDELVEAVRAADADGEPVLILGGGSNLVIADDGFAGTVIKIATTGLHIEVSSDLVAVTAQAGEDWDALVRTAGEEGWAGIEAMSGIPGLVGATPIQNVGAYGQDVAQTITSLTGYDRRSGRVEVLRPSQCGFSYRHSVFKGAQRYVVLEVTYTLEVGRLSRTIEYVELARVLRASVGDRVPIGAVRDAVLDLRRAKGMVLDPADPDTVSAGSFFTNPIVTADVSALLPAELPRWPTEDGRVKISAAALIERAGFAKGYGRGAAGISTKHTLALTNRGGASTAEFLRLAREVRDGVAAKFGITLVNEPVLVGVRL